MAELPQVDPQWVPVRPAEPPVMARPLFTPGRSVAALVLIIAGALALRLPQLGARPMHTDEAVQAVKCGELLEKGIYRYDPFEYHGPTLNYATLPLVAARHWGEPTFAATTESDYRIVPVLFGVATLALLALLADALSWPAALAAAVLLSLSPAFVFYNRYYIHETLFVFSTLLCLAAVWRYVCSENASVGGTDAVTRQHGRIGWAVLAGVAAGLMQASKETSILSFGAMFSGVLGVALWRKYLPGVRPDERRWLRLPGAHVWLAAAGAAGVVMVVLFSSFFTNAQGPLDAIRCYSVYFNRGAGNEAHVHPWYYYLKMLVWHRQAPGPYWTEGFIVLLALIGAISATLGRGLFSARLWAARFLVIYTLALIVVYALIPYKTPWCMLSFLLGLIVLAGIGAQTVVLSFSRRASRIAVCVLLAAGAVHLGRISYATSFTYSADARNPYVYSHTCTDVLRMAQRVQDITALTPEKDQTLIKVVSSEFFPLPWYLRRYPNVGYWREPPQNPDAPIVIASLDVQDDLARKLTGQYHTEFHGLRHGFPLAIYIRADLWQSYLRTRGVATTAGFRF